MNFARWEPIYQSILDDFGFTRGSDEEAAELLAGLLRERGADLSGIRARVAGKKAVVCGNAGCLEGELEGLFPGSGPGPQEVIIAADGASAVLLRNGILPDIVVTDLDGPFEAILEAERLGSLIVVHAHGDNLDALKDCVPQLKRVIGTAQCRPPSGLYNFGGFTDGDRAAFFAGELGASEIKLLGFDLDDESVTPRKRKKLAWARRLLRLVEPQPHQLFSSSSSSTSSSSGLS